MKTIEEMLNEVRKMYDGRYQKVINMERGMKDVNAIHNLIVFSVKDPFENIKRLISGEADKELYKKSVAINKEYVDKFYNIAKPGIEKYWEFTPEFFNSLNNQKILEKFNTIKDLINKEKNSDHSEEHKSFQIEIAKTFPYYINREFEDRMDAKCRKAYYEIMTM